MSIEQKRKRVERLSEQLNLTRQKASDLTAQFKTAKAELREAERAEKAKARKQAKVMAGAGAAEEE